MRIFVLSDTSLETPHPSGHGLGLMVSQIAEGLHGRGHDVTLFAKQGSRFSGQLISIKADGYAGERTLAQVAYAYHKQQPADVILDNGHIHLLSHMFARLPVVNVYHDNYQMYQRNAVVLSEGQRALLPPQFETARIIPNALDANQFRPELMPGKYALFLGAVSDLKQPLLAMEACAKFDIPLIIAGMQVSPFGLPLTRMNNARYIGQVSGHVKHNLLRGARFLLQLSGIESFGLTTLEAMLCGTPVVALPSGGNVDLIEYGISGMFVQPSKDAVSAVCDAMQAAYYLDRERVRQSALRFADVGKQITAYEEVAAAVMRGEGWG
jgi:glycosyltransferase involved in cell wall biosynthesis